MVSLDNSHSNATSWRWHLWEVDLEFALGLPPGWLPISMQGDASLRPVTYHFNRVQGYLDYKKLQPPSTLPQAYAKGPTGFPGVGRLLMG